MKKQKTTHNDLINRSEKEWEEIKKTLFNPFPSPYIIKSHLFSFLTSMKLNNS